MIMLSTNALFFCKVLEKMGSVSIMLDIVEHLLVLYYASGLL